MATILLSRELARRFTDNEVRVELSRESDTVRRAIREMESRFPGISAALGAAVSINGNIYQNCLFEHVPFDAEICFLPAIDGG